MFHDSFSRQTMGNWPSTLNFEEEYWARTGDQIMYSFTSGIRTSEAVLIIHINGRELIQIQSCYLIYTSLSR